MVAVRWWEQCRSILGAGRRQSGLGEHVEQRAEADGAIAVTRLACWRRSLARVFDGPEGSATRVRGVSFVPVVALCIVGVACRLSPPDIVTHYSQGLVPNYSDLQCDWYDPDSTAVQYTYTLPRDMTGEAALDQLQVQISRSGWRRGAPRETCFAVL